MKRQIKRLNRFNKKLQEIVKKINEETLYLTRLKSNEIEDDTLDDIELLWDDLSNLCGDVNRYTACN